MAMKLWLAAGKGVRPLAGKVCVVTGAASGIGTALARALWLRGSHLALVDIDGDGLHLVEQELAGTTGRQQLSTHVADVGDSARMLGVADEVIAAHRSVHVLINNAGIAFEAAFMQTSTADFHRVLDTNLRGVINGCRAFLPHLARNERAHIVNMSSLFGIVAMPGQTAYCASKFAVRGFSEALHEELRATSVGVTVVYAGAVATNIMRRARGDDTELLQRLARWYEQHAMTPERAAKRIIRGVEAGSPRVVITGEAVFGDVLKRLMPTVGNRLFVDAVIRALGEERMRATRAEQWRSMVTQARDNATDGSILQ